MKAFLDATAAARDLTTAIKTARAYGLVLVVDLGELTQSAEVSVVLAGHENAVDDPAPRLRVVE